MADESFEAQLSWEDREAQYLPTPEDIEAGCAAVRRTWSPRMHRARAGMAEEAIEIPSQGSRGRRKIFVRGHD